MSDVISSSAEGNYICTTKFTRPDSDEGASEIGSDEEDEHSRVEYMPNGEAEYIYELKIKRADRNRKICTEAQLKDVFTRTWADFSPRGLTCKIWHDDEDCEITMQAPCKA